VADRQLPDRIAHQNRNQGNAKDQSAQSLEKGQQEVISAFPQKTESRQTPAFSAYHFFNVLEFFFDQDQSVPGIGLGRRFLAAADFHELFFGAADRKPLLIEKVADDQQFFHVFSPVQPLRGAGAHRFDGLELRLPVAKDIRFNIEDFAHLPNAEISFVGNDDVHTIPELLRRISQTRGKQQNGSGRKSTGRPSGGAEKMTH